MYIILNTHLAPKEINYELFSSMHMKKKNCQISCVQIFDVGETNASSYQFMEQIIYMYST